MKNLHSLIYVSILLLALTGCDSSGHSFYESASPIFSGLPNEVVLERLQDPILLDIVTNQPPDERAVMLQLNVASTVFCRKTLRAFHEWNLTGLRPNLPTSPRPNFPEPGFDAFMNDYEQSLETAFSEYDLSSLQDWLRQAGAGCRDVIADPTHPGVTIGEAVDTGINR